MISESRIFRCRKCSHKWEESCGTGRPESCPKCDHEDFYRCRNEIKL